MTKSRGILPARRYWTEAEIALLRDMYPECHSEDVAAWMERTLPQIYNAAFAHGLTKSAEYLASDTACRIQRGKQHPNMIASRIKPGHPAFAWNKGRDSRETGTGHHPNSRRTQFKADGSMRGAAQANYKPIGSERISKDGYLERKVTDDPNVVRARRWVGVHRLVWEAANGPIPAGHVVGFKPGQHTTDAALITTDRLECISRVENMRRNSYHTNYPPEVASLIQLRGALNRQINKRTRAMEAA